jgi:hypothetical protein
MIESRGKYFALVIWLQRPFPWMGFHTLFVTKALEKRKMFLSPQTPKAFEIASFYHEENTIGL